MKFHGHLLSMSKSLVLVLESDFSALFRNLPVRLLVTIDFTSNFVCLFS